MKTGSFAITIILSVCLSHAAWSAANTDYSKVHWSGITAHVVSINLNSPDMKVTVSIAKNGRGSSESFGSMLSRVKPAAAITGTFFCTRSLLPTGDIVVDGKSIHTGSLGTGVCITPNNTVEFVPYSIGHKKKWQGYDMVLCAGPTLVRDRTLWLMPRDQGFRDPALFGNKRRTAVGVTINNKLLFVTVDKPVRLRTLAYMMMHLGAKDAVALDGGSSTALHYNGKTISRPGRSLTNLLVAYESPEAYEKHREALAPSLRGTQIASARRIPAPAGVMVSALRPIVPAGLPESVELLAEYRIEQLGGNANTSYRSGFPVKGSHEDGPMLPDTEAAINTDKTGTSLTLLSMRPGRKAQRDPSFTISDEVLTH